MMNIDRIKKRGGESLSETHPERYNSLNGLRALAALGILLMHYQANIGTDVNESLRSHGLLYSEIIPFFTQFVYMFFIVSAFSMCCGYFNRFRMSDVRMGADNKTVMMSTFDTSRFYSKRYSRIWPFFALLVFLDFVMKPSWSEFCQAFADLTLAFNLLPNPDIEVIGVGWFLGVVFLFYMIFPWFVFLLANRVRAWLVMAVAIAFHVILVRYFLTCEFCTESQINAPRHNIVYSFPFFMAGGLIFIYKERLKNVFAHRLRRLLLLAVTVIMTGIVFTPCSPSFFGEAILYLLVVFILWVVYAVTGGIGVAGFKFLDNNVMRFLSNISMEIYLCHMVIFRVIEKVRLDEYIHSRHLLYWVYCLTGILLAIVFSYTVKNIIFPKCSLLIVRMRNLSV